MAPNSSNTYRKARALLMKTVANGCTAGEAASALGLASTIITKHNLDPARVEWPTPPKGWEWQGTAGRGGTIIETPAKPKPAPKAKRPPPYNKLQRLTNDERLIRFLSRAGGGSTIEEMQREIRMQAHSIRGCISTLKKKTGIKVDYDKATKRYRKV